MNSSYSQEEPGERPWPETKRAEEDQMKSIQLDLHWPHRGFEIDRLHLVSIDGEEWRALCALVSANADDHPLLLDLLQRRPPVVLPRAEFERMKQECERNMSWENLNLPEYSALSTLSFSIGQAEQQREASLILEPSLDEAPDEFTIIIPGTDLFADLEKINA